MDQVKLTTEGHSFLARFETQNAPRSCAAVRGLLPYRNRIIHVRWSGEACWIPMGDFNLGLSPENATSYPAPGQILIYPGGVSETEILLAYGPTHFASKAGSLAGNHVLTIRDDLEKLAAIGRKVLWEGAKDITFEAA